MSVTQSTDMNNRRLRVHTDQLQDCSHAHSLTPHRLTVPND